MRLLLTHAAESKSGDERELSPLYQAAEEGDTGVFSLLLQQPAYKTLTIGLEGAISREYGDDDPDAAPYSHTASERDESHSSPITAPDDLELCL